ncbi:FG-GAP repeat domain-containing protein [Streptomyces sp. NPDC001663]|uniref:FG-GAP repeat domain-containing protein n=1 Tax=Streptomyces sp. NPDC001663 TaxID=3364597 RepID=UPI0036CCE910
MASAVGPLTAKAADCSSGIVFTQSDTAAAVGDNPRHVVTGDLDGDGNADVVKADNDAGAVSVLLGNGDGTFGDATTYTVGDKPYQSVIADFDADGNPDIATADVATAGGVSVALGNGDGTFGEVTEYSSVARLYSITHGDFDGDGRPDLATVSNGSNTPDDVIDVLVSSLNGNSVSVFQGTSGGGLSELTGLTAACAYEAAAADLTGDGTQDLVVASSSNNQVDVFTGPCG